MMKKNLLLILMCFVCGLVYAHDGLNFRNLDVKSGISDNYVRSVLRDQYGFMWFATLNGLNRYDGYQFKKYTTTQLGAYNNDIESIAEDAAGNIWIKGPVSYYIYDREQDKLENKIQPVLNKYGITGEVSYLTVDKDYNLWCTVMDTLFHYDFAKSKLHTFQLPGKEKNATGCLSAFVCLSALLEWRNSPHRFKLSTYPSGNTKNPLFRFAI